MIYKSAKESIKNAIGHRYSPVIQKELIDSNEFNKANQPYSKKHISNVMNGEKHEIIEAAIYRVVEKRLKAQTKRGHILNKKSAVGNEDL